MIIDMREVRLQRLVICNIKRNLAQGDVRWVPALPVALRELARLEGRVTHRIG
jgi:hypothetical protein